MITYLTYSTASMALLLLFYHMILEKEKMHHINRGYLLFSLIFSFTIPFIPVGLADSLIPWFRTLLVPEIQPLPYSSSAEGGWTEFGSEGIMPVTESSGATLSLFTQLALLVYTTVAGVLFVRLLRIFHMIQMKADRNPRRLFDGYEIVLLNENVVPHTFMSTIFLNRQQYQNREIGREVMLHELTHAKQKHTLDILFVEMLKVLLWFNPVLYLYKKAILLNHEFLADQAVISSGVRVSDYQTLLLKTLLGQPSHGLLSNFNYSLTKKRLHMMTQTTPKIRSFLKIIALLPLFVTLALFLGCESTSSVYLEDENEDISQELIIELSDSETIRVNSEEIHISEFEGYLSELPEDPELVHIQADSNALIGVVTDVQKIIRDHGSLKINYSVGKEQGDEELDRVTEDYLEAADNYMNMNAEQTELQILEEAYDEVMKRHQAIKEAEPEIPDAPPPPPSPPSPEKRLENTLKGNLETEPVLPDPPPPPVRKRNLLQILVSAGGLLLINEEPASMNEIKNRVKQFVDNRGADPDLSENPQEAIVAIKTVRQTPYAIYTGMLNEVMAAYSELRDKAAERRFGVSFLSLDKTSDQRLEIEEMYPRNISVISPQGR